MTEENHDKRAFPDATAEIAAMLNIGQSTSEVTPVSAKHDGPSNLPVIEAESTKIEKHIPPTEQVFEPTDIIAPLDMEESKPIEENPTGSKAKALNVLQAAAPYFVIFVVGLFLYQYFFSSFSVSEFLKSSTSITNTNTSQTVAGTAEVNERLVALKKEKAGAYAAWIRQFFYEVSDPSIVDMDNDLSGNGLTNFEKFMLNLNPKAYDTLGLGKPDGQTVMDGMNPWTGKPLSDNQKKIVELYFDNQIISNRLAAGSLKLSQNGIANATTAPNNGAYENPSNYSFVDGTGNTGNTNSAAGTSGSGTVRSGSQVAGAYTNQPQRAGGSGPTTTGEGNSLRSLDINQNVPGELNIPANGIKAPLIFTKDTKNFDSDLTKGVVHYPGTALPGEVGTSYISGHSSGYAWQKNAYKNIFRKLGDVKDGTSFTITVTLNNGSKATIYYVVQSRQEFAANDQAQFVQTADARVALSTCWPIDTSSRRLVLFAKQTQLNM